MKIGLDIETVRAPRDEWAALQGIDLASVESESPEIQRDYERSAFDGTSSRIICIGVVIFTDDMSPKGAVACYGPNEREILSKFWEIMKQEKPDLVITHNGLGFDIPFIKKRSIINQVKPTLDLPLVRYQIKTIYDTMAVWANWEARGNIKLDVLARALGVETKSGSGKQVQEMWEKGEFEAIARYCLQDVYVTYACFSRMNYQDPLPSANVLKNKTLLLMS